MITLINSLKTTTFNSIAKLANEVTHFIRALRSVRQSSLQLSSAKPLLTNSGAIPNVYSGIKTMPLPAAETALLINPKPSYHEPFPEPLYNEPVVVNKTTAPAEAIISHGNEIIYDSPRLFTDSEIALQNNIATQLNAINYFESEYDEIPVKTFKREVFSHENPVEKTGLRHEKTLYVNFPTENNKSALQKEIINKLAGDLNAYYQQQLNILHQIIENQVGQINDGCADSPVKLKYTELAGISVEKRAPRLPPRNKSF